MRWPLRRRRPAAGPAAPAVQREPGRRGGRDDWRRLAPPALTASRRPPILHDGLGALPDVAGTRALLPRANSIGQSVPLSVTRAPSGARALVHASRTQWSAPQSSAPESSAPESPAPESSAGQAAGHVPDVSVRVAPVVDSPVAARQITRATNEYVGEAREPATPYKSSEWLRLVAAARPPWLNDSDEKIAPLPSAPRPAAPTPSRSASQSAPSAARAGLGASRRLGLGPPQPGGRAGQAGNAIRETPEQASTEQASTEQASTEQASTEQASTEQASIGQAPTGQRSTGPGSTGSGRGSGGDADPPSGGGAGAAYGTPGELPGTAGQSRRAGKHAGPLVPAPATDAQLSAPAGLAPAPGRQAPVPAGRTAVPRVPAPIPGGRPDVPVGPPAAPGPGPLPPASAAPPAPDRERMRFPREESAPPRTHRLRPKPAQWWRKSEPEHTAPPVSPSPPDEQDRAADGPLPAGTVTGSTVQGSAAQGGGAPRAGVATDGGADTRAARLSPDVTAPAQPGPALEGPVGPHPPRVAATGRGDWHAALQDQPELILAPPVAVTPVEAVPGAEPGDAGPPEQPPPHPAFAAGRGAPPGGDVRGVTKQRDDYRGEPAPGDHITGPSARVAGHPPVTAAPAEVRYRSALDPLLPVPPSLVAPAVRVPVTAPSASAAHAAAAARRGDGGRPARRYQPAPGDIVTERVPAGLASAFSALHGTDVSDVPVRRGRGVARQATRLDAAAFSHDGVVYLPDSAGSLGQRPAQALLAHELTHAVQQRMLGDALPGEASAEGRELEEQAMATQRWVLGDTGPVPALALLPSPAAPRLTHVPTARHAAPAADGESIASVVAAGQAGERGVQRQAVDAAPVVPVASAGSATADAAAPGISALDPSAAVTDAHPGLAELRAQVAELAGRRPAALDDPVELDELAAKLYRRLRTKLRLELIVDRERTGLLTDFR
jgi:hypothetical protein